MINTRDIDDMVGAEAVDESNEKIGKVGQVYVDSDSDNPTWVTVKSGLFGTSETLVPLDGADFFDSALHLAVSKDRVKDAPRVEPDGELTPQEQQRLYEYYGVASGVSGQQSFDDTTTYDTTTDDAAFSDSALDADRDQGVREQGVTGQEFADQGVTGVGHDTSGPNTDDAMTRSEERVKVGTQQVESGRARLKKYVVSEQQTVTVPVTREEVRIEREPITEANRGAATDGPALSEEEHEVVLTEERPVVATETVPVERIRLAKEEVTEQRDVTTDVSHEEIETDGGVNGAGRGN